MFFFGGRRWRPTMDLKVLLFSFDGRINRARYWLAFGLWLAVWCAAVVIAFLLGALFGSSLSFLVMGLMVILGLFGIISSIAVGVKRLHDRGKSGWWLVLFYAVPGILTAAAPPTEIAGNLLLVLSAAIEIWALVELGCLPGTAGPNQYGPDPLAVVAAQPT
jgi:uncharacterized membrane protein YhaH (DUF805 family)